ncbi:hypothetical protein H7X65_02975, partial [Candidatus Parcubacteria bacterium]|nr:hypothetical protein [Candidatus Parcubacteria bacterium]
MTFKYEIQLLTLLIVVLLSAISFVNTGQNMKDIDYIKEYRLSRDYQRLQRIIDNTSAEGIVVYDATSKKVLGSKN